MRAQAAHISLGFSLAALLLLSACTVTPVQDVETATAATEISTAAANAAAAVSPLADKLDSASQSPDWVQKDCTAYSLPDTPARVSRRKNPKILAQWFPEGKRIELRLVIEVTPEGRLGRLAFSPPDADPRVVRAIEKSLQSWRFRPAMHKGQPVPACFEQPYDLIFPAPEAGD